MWGKITTGILSLALLALTFSTTPAHAGFQPSSFTFGSCPNPGGSVVASYSSGQHWIVGNNQLQYGSDAVYSNGNNSYTQCYCPLTANNQPTGGLGTQTNWLYAASVSSQDRQNLLNNGWVSVPDGSAFGLSSGEYLAKNSSFSCGNQVSISCNTNVSQSNTAIISNNVSSSANTGNNNVSFNTGGNSQVSTGNAVNTTTIINNANANILKMQQDMQNHLFHVIISDNGAFSLNHVNF